MFLEFDSTHYRYFSKKFKFFFQIFSYFYSKIFVFWAYLVKNEYFRISSKIFEDIRPSIRISIIFEYFLINLVFENRIRIRILRYYSKLFVFGIRFEIRIFSNIFIFEIRIVRAYPLPILRSTHLSELLKYLSAGWPDGYFSGHFWQMWLFLGAVFYKKNFWLYFGLVAILWLFFNLFKNKKM